MKFDEIVSKLATQDVVEINGGAVMLKKRLKKSLEEFLFSILLWIEQLTMKNC